MNLEKYIQAIIYLYLAVLIFAVYWWHKKEGLFKLSFKNARFYLIFLHCICISYFLYNGTLPLLVFLRHYAIPIVAGGIVLVIISLIAMFKQRFIYLTLPIYFFAFYAFHKLMNSDNQIQNGTDTVQSLDTTSVQRKKKI